MALIKCSECGKKISDKADKCPNCGAPVEKKTSIEKEKRMIDNTGVQIALAIIIFVCVIVPIYISASKTDHTGVVMTFDGVEIVGTKDFEIIYDETEMTRSDEKTVTIVGKIKQNTDDSYTQIIPTLNLLDSEGNKIRQTTGVVLSKYEGDNIWSFQVFGNDADGIASSFDLESCYGY